MGFRRGNDWRSQPRDANGQFKERAHVFAPRSEILRLRLTKSERQFIERAADQAGMSMTAFVVIAIRSISPLAHRKERAVVCAHQKRLVRRLRSSVGRHF